MRGPAGGCRHRDQAKMPNAPSGTAVLRVPRVLLAAVGIALALVLVLKTVVLANPAAHFVVDSTVDAVDSRTGDGVCRTIAGQCTLRAAVQESNALAGPNSIDVPAGTYSLAIPPRNENGADTGDLDITGSLAITGSGAGSTFIDAGSPPAGAPPDEHGLDRLFEVAADGGTVGFSGMTLSDGYAAEYGGAIANNSTAAVTVSSSSLTGNVAGKAGGAIDNHLEGAVDVNDSTLSGNFAYESGSALNNNRGGTLSLTNSTVSGNTAAAIGLDPALRGAGAIANSAELDAIGIITVTESRISENHSGGAESGAAISNNGGGRVDVEETTFLKNHSEVDGGAIFNGAGEVTVTGSTFAENVAKNGGAVYNSVKDGRVTVSESSFSLNAASAHGGAIASGGTGTLTVVNSTFSKNSSGDAGGAVLNEDKSSATIENTSFTENSAAGEGGGMHANSAGEVAITGGAFTLNKALAGGAFSIEGGGQVTIDGTSVGSNRAVEQGGGILVASGAVRMVNIDVVGNIADAELEGGGGIAYAGDKLVSLGESATIQNSRIRDNKAKGEGGGIDSRGDGPLGITTTAITGNVAGAGGGIHHVGDAPLDVTRSTLSSNSAESGGGVFSDGDGEATIENTTVSGNRAGKFGGGLHVSSRLTLRNSTLAGNSAASGGGINNGGGDVVGDGSVFLANTIIASSPTGGNCIGTMTSRGGNLDSANTCQLSELSDQPGTDSRLGPLADNGGPTQTHALLSGSPAQEKSVCSQVDPCPPVDQRGIDRPQFAGVDAGAYESELAPGGGGTQTCSGPTERPVPADFDSWVSQSAPSANFGGDSILKVASQGGGNERALVHFRLPSVPPGCRLVGATLRVHSSSAAAGRTLEALRVSSDWSESGVTWSSQPATAGPASTAESGLELREWDVLAQTLDMYELGGHGFLLRDRAENGSGEQSFHSREKGAQSPELVLLFDDPDPPPL
jgi:CSLREA domain-containing protein